ncbi:nuclear transport factor 2 family protein [Caballeronia sp. SEWSISQ10-4 2]|uniref:nuclear transport factor 2 family protein n=1 Tax=Caballeronia sp. SEWSISQ10-4 2 TaxID=2937438 RepID=UPI0026502BD8|nr:nuclear transport factor 2 family protein [Caballeronia sp. SEWSISQ10-4 2]MDN7179212.1 nuclear transport factor 2 family protein [Caballeronia sp. SEWSISQ10-4 2]
MDYSVYLAARVARLEALEAIRSLKARYAALADQKYMSTYQRQPDEVMIRIARQQAECFTVDAVWAGGAGFGDDLVGRDALENWFRKSPWRYAEHFYTGEHITMVDERKAGATWRLWQLALRDDDAHAVLLAATTTETYERDYDGVWRISTMRFDQLDMLECGSGPLPLAATLVGLDAIRAANLNRECR